MPKVIDPELKARAVRLVLEHRAEYPTLTAAGQVQRGGVRLIRRGQAVRACGMGWSVASWVVVVAWDLARTSRPR